MALTNNLQIMYWLWRRDIKAFMKGYKDNLINNLFLISCVSFVFTRLTPLMGIGKDLGGDTLVGFAATVILFTCYMSGLEDIFDLHLSGFIRYRSRLPLPFHYFLFQIIVSYAIKALLVAFPALTFSMVFFQDIFVFSSIHWAYFFAMMLLSAFFFATFFVFCVFHLSLEVYKERIWVRLLWPLEAFGCLFFSWKSVALYAPRVAFLFLFNPFTYVVEGLRSSLLPASYYLHPGRCIVTLFGTTLVLLVVLFFTTKRKIDAV